MTPFSPAISLYSLTPSRHISIPGRSCNLIESLSTLLTCCLFSDRAREMSAIQVIHYHWKWIKYENYAGAAPEIMLIHDKDFLLNQKSLLLFIANLQEPIIIMMGSCNLLFLPLTFDQKHTIFTPNSLSSSFSSETIRRFFFCGGVGGGGAKFFCPVGNGSFCENQSIIFWMKKRFLL